MQVAADPRLINFDNAAKLRFRRDQRGAASDKIKIDRSFTQGFADTDRDAKTVVKTIIALGRELNMRVTVEGVETAKQAAFLDKADGDQAQGFYYGRPLPASELAASILADFQKVTSSRSPGLG